MRLYEGSQNPTAFLCVLGLSILRRASGAIQSSSATSLMSTRPISGSSGSEYSSFSSLELEAISTPARGKRGRTAGESPEAPVVANEGAESLFDVENRTGAFRPSLRLSPGPSAKGPLAVVSGSMVPRPRPLTELVPLLDKAVGTGGASVLTVDILNHVERGVGVSKNR